MSCTYLAPNNTESLLYDGLSQFVGPETAAQVWNYVRSNEFAAKFPTPEVDANGEPTVDWTMKNLSLEPVKRRPPDVIVDETSFSALPGQASFEDVQVAIGKLVESATKNPDKEYYVRMGDVVADGTMGYLPSKASFLTWLEAFHDYIEKQPLPFNIRLSSPITQGINNISNQTQVIKEGGEMKSPESIKVFNDKLMDIQRKAMYIQISDQEGNPTGQYMTSEQQQAVTDAIMYQLVKVMGSDHQAKALPTMTRILAQFVSLRKAYTLRAAGKKTGHPIVDGLEPEEALTRNHLLTDVIHSWPAVMKAFEQYASFFGIDLNLPSFNKLTRGTMDVRETLQNVSEDDANLDLFIQELHNKEGWQDISVEIDPMDTASGRIKMFLSTIEDSDLDTDGKLVERTNMLGLPQVYDLEDIFEEAMELLTDTEATYTNFKRLLLESGRPSMVRLADRLETTSEQNRREFVKVFSKHHHTFKMVLFEKKKGGIIVKPIDTNQASARRMILNQWQQNQKSAPIVMEAADGSLVINRTVALDLLEKIRDKGYDRKKLAQEILDAHGITLPDAAFAALVNQTAETTRKTRYKGSNLTALFGITQQGQPTGPLSALVTPMVQDALFAEDLVTFEQEDEVVTPLKINNPMYSGESGALGFLADLAAKHSKRLYTSSFRSIEGKSTWAYSMKSFEAITFRKLLEDPSFREKYQTDVFARTAWLLPQFEQGNLTLEYMGGVRNERGSDYGAPREKMSEREQMATSLWLFQNKGLGTTTLMDQTKADKSKRSPMVSNVAKIPIYNHQALTPKIYSEIVNVVRSEMDRIAKVTSAEEAGGAYTDAAYIRGGKYFYLTPEFNFDYLEVLKAKDIITDEDLGQIWHDRGSLNTEMMGTPTQLAVMKKVIDWMVRDMTTVTVEDWVKAGITSTTSASEVKYDSAYMKKVLNNYGLIREGNNFKRLTGERETPGQPKPSVTIPAEEALNIINRHAALDYSLHYYLFNASMSQLISGDPAQSYKVKASAETATNDFQRVAVSLIDYVKRLAKDVAPGQDPAWTGGPTETYNVISLNDVKTAANYLSIYEKAYSDINSTDAQELTTVREHIYVQFAMGLIPQVTYNEMVAIIDDGVKNHKGYYEFIKPDHLEIVLNPVKPVYVGERYENGTRFIDYIKSSSYPLYPPMTRGTEIDGLRMDMEGKVTSTGLVGHIARAHFASAKKVGLPINMGSAFDSAGRYTGELTATTTLTREGFRIQQEVPYDEGKDMIRIVSQANKLLVEGLQGRSDLSFEVEGYEGKLTGPEIAQLKEEVRVKMFEKSYRDFAEKIGAGLDGDQSLRIGEQDRIIGTLLQEATSRDYPINDIVSLLIRNSNGSLNMPLLFNASADKFESLLMALNKQVAVIKMPGRSYVQASPTGHRSIKKLSDLEPDEKNKIVYTQSMVNGKWKTYDPSVPLKGLDIDGNTVEPARVFLPFSFLENGKNMNIDDFTKLDENGIKVIDPDKLPPRVLRLLGFRIPNQGHNSMLPIEIAGFIPNTMGDLMIVPDTVIVQMGSDFDVDKLYVYRLPYTRYDDGSYDIDEKDDEVVDYFNIHWSILTHPKIFPRIIAPLDKADLKNEADKLDKLLLANTDLPRRQFQGTSQILDYLAQKDAKGLVGLTSLTSTFNAVIQAKALTLQKKNGTDWEATTFSRFRDEFTGEIIHADQISGYGTSLYNEEDYVPKNAGGKLTVKEAQDLAAVRTKGDNIAIQQSEAVDYTKNRVIDRVNLNNYTYKASAAISLLQSATGQAFSVKFNSRLMMQPIIREYVAAMASGNDQLSENISSNLNERVINDLAETYRTQAYFKVLEDTNKKYPERTMEENLNEAEGVLEELLKPREAFSPQMLLRLLTAEKDLGYYLDQLQVLEIFSELNNLGEEITSIQSMVNQDTKGAGPSILHAINQQKRVNEKTSSTIAGWTELLEPDSEIGTLFRMTTATAPVVFSPLLPYNQIFNLYEGINSQIGRKLSVDEMRDVTREFRAYTYGEAFDVLGITDPHAERIRLLYSTRDHASLPSRIEAMKRELPNNILLARIQTTLADKRGDPDALWVQAAQLTRADEYTVVRDWMDMLTGVQGDTAKTLAEDLVRYVFVTGARNDVRSLARFVPASYLAAIGFGSKLGQVNLVQTPNAFLYQWMQHHPQNVRHIPETIATGDTFMTPSMEAITIGSAKEYQDLLVQVDVEGGKILAFPIFVSQWDDTNSQWKLYVKTQEDESGAVIYSRVDTLGHKGVMEYNATAGATRSAFADNRVKNFPSVNPDGYINATEATAPYFTRWFPDDTYEQEALIARVRQLLDAGEFSSPYQEALRMVTDVAAQQSQGNLTLLKDMKAYLKSLGADVSRVTILEDGLNLDVVPIKDAKGRPDPTIGGSYASSTQGINLNSVYLNGMSRTQASETVAHEFTHHLTAPAIAVFEVLRSKALEAGQDIYDQFAAKYPEMFNHITELDRLFTQARAAALSQLEPKDISKVMTFWNTPNSEFPVVPLDNRIIYLLSNLAEFATGATTSPIFIKFLNQIKDGERSLLAKVLDKFVEILQMLAKSVGIDIDPESNLASTLRTISGMMSLTTSPEYHTQTDTWKTENILKANLLRDQGVEVTADSFGVYALKTPVAHLNMTTSDIGIMERSLTRLQLQRKEILNRMTNLKDPVIYARKQAVLEMIDESIRELKATTTPETLRTIAETQLRYVDKVLADPNASVNDVMMAWKLTDAWINMGDLLFPDAEAVLSTIIPPSYVEGLEEKARLRRSALLNLKMQSVFTSQSTIGVTDKDFNEGLVDISTPSLLMRSMDHAKSKLTQEIALFLQNAGRRRDTAFAEYLRGDLSTLDKAMEKARKGRNMKSTDFYDMFFQDNEQETAWGLVQQFSYDWYATEKTTRKDLEQSVRKINSKVWADRVAQKRALDNAWGKFHRARSQQSYTLPVHEIFDTTGKQVITDFSGDTRDASGKLVPGGTAKGIYQALEKALGKDKANELVKEAGEKYKLYLDDKDAHDADIDAAILDGRLTAVEGASAKAMWVATNSPVVYTQARYQTLKVSNLTIIPVDALKYVVEVPRPDYHDGAFYDKKYRYITGHQDLMDIHSQIQKLMDRFTSYLPLYMQREIGPNFLPIVQREMLTEVTNAASLKGWISTQVIDALTASPYQEEQQANKERQIPVNYVSTQENERYKSADEVAVRQDELGTRSRDITHILRLFGVSALHYKYFSAVRDVTEMGQTIIAEINNQRKLALQTSYQNGSVVDKQKALDNTLKSLNYTMDALMYKRARDLEMNTGAKIYSLNPMKQVKASREVKKLERELIDLKNKKNTMSKEEYYTEEARIQKKLADYDGRTIYGSKGADVLMNITQLKALAYNPFSAAANMTFGIVSSMTHANGRQDFDLKSFWKAFGLVMAHSTRKAGSFGAWQSPTAKKIFNILEKTGVMADIVDSQYGKGNVSALKEKWKTNLSPYQMMRTSDYFMRALNTVAYMIHQKVDVTLDDGSKSSVTAWEAFDDNGDFRYTDEEWNGQDDTKRSKWEAFRNRAIRVNAIIMGNMDKNSPVWTKKYMLGRLISQFRLSWLGEGFASRFEREKYDAQLGRIVKGRWRTYVDLGTKSFITVGKQLLSLIPGTKINPFDVEMRDGRTMADSDVDVENMRRNFAELGFLTTLAITVTMLKYSKEDDDENKAKLQLLINMLTRTEQDIWFYASPDAFNTVFNRAIPAVNTLNDYQKAMSAFMKIMTDDEYEWEQFILAMTRAGLPIPQAALYNKIKYMTERDLGSINN